jgi:hypothetical protein
MVKLKAFLMAITRKKQKRFAKIPENQENNQSKILED